MIEREKITIQVKRVVEKNKIEQSFLPIIEEFFYRVADQYDWTDYDLGVAIGKFEKVNSINFVNLWENKITYRQKRVGAFCDYNSAINRTSISFDVDDLKSILRLESNKTKEFINKAMHEQGHALQTRREGNYLYKTRNDKYYTGFKVGEIDIENQEFLTVKGAIINEIAEIINAERLTERKYFKT